MTPPPSAGDAVSYAAVRETHSGVVLLMGDRAYKFKKPVDLGFLDFSTVERRAQVCHREVALNRRLAPDVYLGVADLVGPSGDVEDHMVVMRRMPDDRRLSTLVRSGADVAAAVRTVARQVAALHATSTTDEVVRHHGGGAALAGRWEASFDQLRADPAPVLSVWDLDEVERLVHRFVHGRSALFAERVTSAMIADGHGDLLADDIFCLDDGPRVLDCLEFDDALRHVDGIDDVACLAMDLEHLGDEVLASRLVEWYIEFSGDHPPQSLVHHYIAYRAFVRAKVACVRHAQGDVGAASEARSLAALTLRHLRTSAVSLVLVGGSPGTGKSTLAGGLADRLGMAYLSSDRIRKELAGLPAESSAASDVGTGLYTSENSDRTYAELVRRAGALLEMGESVVLDATWGDERQRARAEELAGRLAADVVRFRCRLPDEAADDRINARHGVSDADVVVAAALRPRFAPWPDATWVDTSQSPLACVDTAARLLSQRAGTAVPSA